MQQKYTLRCQDIQMPTRTILRRKTVTSCRRRTSIIPLLCLIPECLTSYHFPLPFFVLCLVDDFLRSIFKPLPTFRSRTNYAFSSYEPLTKYSSIAQCTLQEYVTTHYVVTFAISPGVLQTMRGPLDPHSNSKHNAHCDDRDLRMTSLPPTDKQVNIYPPLKCCC